ncbi:MAG: hypothetical protein ABIJ21_09015 [Nanoarchaeota archaeon]
MTIKKIARFESPNGFVEIGLGNNNAIHVRIDGIPYSRHEYAIEFDPEIIKETIRFESRFWHEQQRPVEEIDYNLDNLEYKLRQWPYIRKE